MKIYRIAMLTEDVEDVYYGLKIALKHLGNNNMGKAKNEIRKAIKGMEKIRPALKNKKVVIPNTERWRQRKEFL